MLEGVAFGLRDGLDLMLAAGHAGAGPDPRLGRRHGERRCGARSSPTSCGAEIATVSTTEGAAYGAGAARGRRRGLVPDASRRPRDAVRARDAGRGAGPGRGALRRARTRAYRALYPALAPLVPAALDRAPGARPEAGR